MKKIIYDKIKFDIPNKSQRIKTPEGYLLTAGRVARTGIQEYTRSDVGDTTGDPQEIVKVYRPEKEVFNKKSLDSYEHKDITIEHPHDLLNSENFKINSVGHVKSSGRRDEKDPKFVVADFIIKDQEALRIIEDNGKNQLSAGYTANFENKKGVYEGEDYDFIQTDIYINHVAIVDNARAGEEARLFDSKKRNKEMHKIKLLDHTISIEDESAAAAIQATIDSLKHKVADAEEENSDAFKKAKDDVEKLKDQLKKAEDDLEKMKEKTSDSAIDSQIKKIVDARTRATSLLKSFTTDSTNEIEIFSSVLSSLHPKINFSDKSDDYIRAYFDAEEASKEKAEDEDEDDKKAEDEYKKEKSMDSYNQLTKDMRGKKTIDSRSRLVNDLENSWKKTIGLGE